MDLNLDLLQKIGAITVACITIGTFIYKKILIKYFRNRKEKIQRQQEIWAKIDKIEKEITPNGGGSIKDKINSTCHMVNQIKQMAERVAGKQMADYYASKTPMFESGKNGECLWVNHAYCNLTGRSFDEIKGEGWRTCIHDEDSERVFINWAHCVDDNRDFHDKYRLKRPNGEVINIECNAHRINDSNGNVLGWLGYIKAFSHNINLNYET